MGAVDNLSTGDSRCPWPTGRVGGKNGRRADRTSQVSLTQSRTDQLTANYNYLVALANVRKAIGLSDALVNP